MDMAKRYYKVNKDGIIDNIIMLSETAAVNFPQYHAIPANYPVNIGDYYKEGKFYTYWDAEITIDGPAFPNPNIPTEEEVGDE